MFKTMDVTIMYMFKDIYHAVRYNIHPSVSLPSLYVTNNISNKDVELLCLK